MDAERLRAYLLTLPHIAETRQWGNNLVYWVGDKAIGGKMFALINLDDPQEGRTHAVVSYSAGPLRFPDLLELDGLYPAPYMARIHWVAAEHWQIFSNPDWESEVQQAHALTFAKLPPKIRTILAMPRAAQRRLIHEGRQKAAGRKSAVPDRPKSSKPSKKRPISKKLSVGRGQKPAPKNPR
jgi:predicted DNA-binding protein (MmcQ/YjbR family)